MANELTIHSVNFALKRDTQANLALENSIPAAGEPIFETDTFKLKIGNGTTNYNNLPYIGELAESNPILEGYFNGIDDFYQDEEMTSIMPQDSTVLYIDLNDNKMYRYDLKTNNYVVVSPTLSLVDVINSTTENSEAPSVGAVRSYVQSEISMFQNSLQLLKTGLESKDAKLEENIGTLTNTHTTDIAAINVRIDDLIAAYVADMAATAQTLREEDQTHNNNLIAYIDAKIGEVEDGSY